MKSDIETNNLIEEIQDIVEKCNNCGLCKSNDLMFKITGMESESKRGKAILLSKKIFDKKIFEYCLDGSCKNTCPFKIDLDSAIIKARQVLNLQNKENEDNKKLLNKIKNKENPFLEENKK